MRWYGCPAAQTVNKKRHQGIRTNPQSTERNEIMNVKCPKCGGNAYLKHNGRAVGTLAGTGAGGYAGWAAGAAGGAKAGALVGSFFGPVGAAAGATAGSILGALTGAAAGAAAGNKLGGMIDEDVIRTYHCPDCGHEFNRK